MKRMLWAAATLLLVGAVVTWPAGAGSAKTAALHEADRAFDRATNARGLEGFDSFLAENVTTLRQDRPVIQGKEAVREVWTVLLTNPQLSIRWQPQHAAISSGGDLGYTIGAYQILAASEKDRRVTGTGKYVTVWRKQVDGSWKVEFDSGVAYSQPEAGTKPAE